MTLREIENRIAEIRNLVIGEEPDYGLAHEVEDELMCEFIAEVAQEMKETPLGKMAKMILDCITEPRERWHA